MKKSVYTVFLLLCLISAAYAQADLQPIAEVNLSKREPVTLRQLKLQVSNLEKVYGRKLSVEERRKVLDSIINERLVKQAAEREGVKIADSQVNEYFNNLLSQQVGYPITESEFSKLIKNETNQSLDEFMKAQTGMGVEESKEFLRGQIAVQMYVMQKKASELQNIAPPTDAEIRSQYEINKQSFVRPDTVKLFLVVVPKEGDGKTGKAKIDELNKKLSADHKLVADIKKNSGKENGYIAEFIYAARTPLAAQQLGITMDALMEIFKQKINFVSPVTDMPTNYQFFVVMEKLDAKILILSDVVDPNQTTTVYEYIRQSLAAEKQNHALQEAIQSLTDDLRISSNFKILKQDEALNKLLSW